MKFLTVPRLQKMSGIMQAVDVGDRIIHARVEAYSCKLAGTDKRTAKEITSALDASISHASNHHHASTPQTSPLGELHEPATKHLLVSLITTLNASYPDFDFSNLRPDEFQRESSPQVATNAINSLFLTAVSSSLSTLPGLRTEFWSAVDETIVLNECEVYKYEASEESDLNSGKLWTMNYFFYNRKMKKMLLLTAEAVSKLHLQNSHSQAYEDMLARRHAHTGDDEGEEFDDYAEDDEEEDDDDEDMMGDSSEAGPTQRGGAYVDVNLLTQEWDGMPLDHLQDATSSLSVISPQHASQAHPAGYETSPSTSSTSTAATLRVRPLHSADSNMNISTPNTGSPQIRLATTRTPLQHPLRSKLGSTNSPTLHAMPSSAIPASFTNSASQHGQGVSLFAPIPSSAVPHNTNLIAQQQQQSVSMFAQPTQRQ